MEKQEGQSSGGPTQWQKTHTRREEYSGTIEVMDNVEGTPFTIVGNKEEGYMLVMGQYKLSDKMEHPDDVLKWMEKETWKLNFNFVTTIITIVLAEREKNA